MIEVIKYQKIRGKKLNFSEENLFPSSSMVYTAGEVQFDE